MEIDRFLITKSKEVNKMNGKKPVKKAQPKGKADPKKKVSTNKKKN